MRTAKSISTISFNTPDFLKLKLRELTSAGRISFWSFIVHNPEDDEGGKKEHIHLFIEPSKMLQTDDLKQDFAEFDFDKPDKPKTCISFVSSKFNHWYLYSLHDRRYLASKGQSRKFHYVIDDFVSSSYDELLYRVRSIDLLSLSPYADIEDAIDHGLTFQEYFARGTIPIQQIKLYEIAWNLMQSDLLNRNGRKGHENY